VSMETDVALKVRANRRHFGSGGSVTPPSRISATSLFSPIQIPISVLFTL